MRDEPQAKRLKKNEDDGGEDVVIGLPTKLGAKFYIPTQVPEVTDTCTPNEYICFSLRSARDGSCSGTTLGAKPASRQKAWKPNHGYYLHKYNYVALLNVLVFRASCTSSRSAMQRSCGLIAKM